MAVRFRFTLARRFLAVNLVILVVGGLIAGVWTANALERGILDRTASVTALYVDSFVEPHLQGLAASGTLSPAETSQLDKLLTGGPLGDLVVSLRVWSPSGTIVYGSLRELVGQSFPIRGELASAFAGTVSADLSDLTSVENAVERRYWSRLLEMYIPVRESGGDRIIAVVEFYQSPDAIDREVANARLTTWAIVAGAIGIAFLLLYGIVKQGSDTIGRQEEALQRQVGELSGLLARNAALNAKVRAAAERTTTLNERALRRISADLHDGPGQALALALLSFDAVKARRAAALPEPELADVEGALRDALRDMRSIAAGLRMPELASMDVAEIASRAAQDHTRRSGTPVDLEVSTFPRTVALSVKIALYRALQELLSNATRHGGGVAVTARVTSDDRYLALDVSDAGPGFDVGDLAAVSGLGLAGMREQAELLGGDFAIDSHRDRGTTVRVRWQLAAEAPPAPASSGPAAIKPRVKRAPAGSSAGPLLTDAAPPETTP